ncbi:MAG: response regulator, partial [Spirochaetales bacterium]|nr:response regulator [Spirochaetales bacterium]
DENLSPGSYAFVEVRDTGCGMTRETAGRVFDPFFTTKFAGRGLGMSAVLGILRGHGGAVKIDSELGRGTTFTLYFPASSKPAPLAGAAESAGLPEARGTVLLADDEDTVRRVGGSMLEKLGFGVLIATDGMEAVELYKQHRDDIVFVLMDLTMPNMGGEEACRAMLQIDPNVRVIMSSGYGEQEIKSSGPEAVAVLQKPYLMSKLKAVIQEVMED